MLDYKPAAFLSGGFAAGPVALRTIEQGPPQAPASGSPALVAYVRVLGVRAGDLETLSVTGPAGAEFGSKGPVAIKAPKAEWLSFFGRKRRDDLWPKGEYRATYRLERDGNLLIEEQFSVLVQ